MKNKKQYLSKRDKAFNKIVTIKIRPGILLSLGKITQTVSSWSLEYLNSILKFQPIAWDDTAITSSDGNHHCNSHHAKTSALMILGKEVSGSLSAVAHT